MWYAEADDPTGPWRYAVKVVTHDRMSFYNPKQHPMFAKDGGRVIYFEGTYTHDFSGNPDATPRYDYNQMMYRLDLADPRIALPRPVPGRRLPGPRSGRCWERSRFPEPKNEPFLHAPGRQGRPGATVPLYEFTDKTGERRYAVGEKIDGFTRGKKAVGRVWP